jgi:hypothetical protein
MQSLQEALQQHGRPLVPALSIVILPATKAPSYRSTNHVMRSTCMCHVKLLARQAQLQQVLCSAVQHAPASGLRPASTHAAMYLGGMVSRSTAAMSCSILYTACRHTWQQQEMVAIPSLLARCHRNSRIAACRNRKVLQQVSLLSHATCNASTVDWQCSAQDHMCNSP